MAKGEGLGQSDPFTAPASYLKQMKEPHGAFHLTEAELLRPGVLHESARAEKHGLPTSLIPHWEEHPSSEREDELLTEAYKTLPQVKHPPVSVFSFSSSQTPWAQESGLDTQWLAVAICRTDSFTRQHSEEEQRGKQDNGLSLNSSK